MADAQAGVVGVLEGKVAVLTGASRGIGRATAVSFASAGADVAAWTSVGLYFRLRWFPLGAGPRRGCASSQSRNVRSSAVVVPKVRTCWTQDPQRCPLLLSRLRSLPAWMR
jgi:hypothetical protein